MLLQAECLTVFNPENSAFLPVPSQNNPDRVSEYSVVNNNFQEICSITPREMEVVLLLVAQQPKGRILRTAEWGVVDGSLNYRFARVLADNIDGTLSDVTSLIKDRCTNNTPDKQAKTLECLRLLAEDREYYDITALGRKVILDNHFEIKDIAGNWDKYFIELPF